MFTASFIWLILSHIAVLIPIYIGTVKNNRRWLPCNIVLFTTSIYSSLYHWYDKEGINKNTFLILDKIIFFMKMVFFVVI